MNITVLGIGNLLLCDDGVGVHAINKLRDEYEFPEHVKLIDGGTKGLDLLPLFENQDKVLIIDAANFKKEPGTIDTVEGDGAEGGPKDGPTGGNDERNGNDQDEKR